MLFTRLSAVAAGAIIFSAAFHRVSATDSQQQIECEQKCSQHWSFPAPAQPSTTSSKMAKAKATTYTSSVHTTSYTPPPPEPTTSYTPPPPEPTTSYTPPPPEPTSSSAVVNNAQVKPSSSAKKQVAAAAPTPTPEPAPAPAPAPAPSPSPAASSPDIAAYLDPHNAARAAHGAGPLKWSDELAAAAQGWASGCVFKHSGGSLGPYGENLAAGSGDYSPGSGVQAWVNEAPEYSSSSPVPSHFTQVVWKATSQVGCAVASCNLANFDKQFWPVKFHVCEYSSAGNVIGQFAANVQA